MTISPLDKEYPIEVPAEDSPLFHDLVQHWEGDAETVVNMEQHYYQEIISLTVVQQHVVTIRAHDMKVDYVPDSNIRAMALERYGTGLISKQVDTARLFDDDKIDDTLTRLQAYTDEESKRRVRWRKTRLFFKMVRIAYHTARESS